MARNPALPLISSEQTDGGRVPYDSGMETSAPLMTYPPKRTCPLDPSHEFARLRAEQPITRVRLEFDGSEVWLVTGYEDICAVLRDRRFSADFSRPGFPARMTAQPPGPGTFIRMDAPDHSRLRRALVGEFKANRVAALHDRVQDFADRLIDDMLGGPAVADLVQAIALPLPILVICELLGVPYADQAFFQRCTSAIGDQNVPPAKRQVVRTELWEYMARLVAAKRSRPEDDLLSRLVRDQQQHKITDEEAVGIATLLIIAGYETIANQIGIGTLALIANRDRDGADTGPSQIAAAVDEILRHQTIIAYGLRRVAIEDVEVAGQIVRAGEGIVVVLGSGNRDERRFTDPDRLDLHREVTDHLAFGYGVHQCMGQLLARLELRVLWETLFRRVPTLRLAVPMEEVPFRDDMFVYGVHKLPVTW
jgi:cytochrome P450